MEMVGMLRVLTGMWAHKCVLAYTFNSVATSRSIILNKSLKIPNLVYRLRYACQSRGSNTFYIRVCYQDLQGLTLGLHRSHFQKTTLRHKTGKRKASLCSFKGSVPTHQVLSEF